MKKTNEINNSTANTNMIKYSSFRIRRRDNNNYIPQKTLNNDSQIKPNNSSLKSDINNPTLNYYIIRSINNGQNIYNENDLTKNIIIIIIVVILLLIIIGIVILYFSNDKQKKSNIDDLFEPITDNH